MTSPTNQALLAAGPLVSAGSPGAGEISLAVLELQNGTPGSEGLPKDLPSGYDWYTGGGVLAGTKGPPPYCPSGFTSMTGYGVVYQEIDTPDAVIPGLIEVRNMVAYVRRTTDKVWLQVQDETTLDGGHFVADFSGNQAISMDIRDAGGGIWTMDGPARHYNNHWWPNPRGSYAVGTVDGCFCVYEIRVTDPGAVNCLLAQCGIDWWRTPDADFLSDFSNNPGAAGGNWVKITNTFKPVSCISLYNSDIEDSLPPHVVTP